MQNRAFHIFIPRLCLIFLLAFFILNLIPADAQALPLFAKKYRLPCKACHEAFPKLNDFGNLFRMNGYQLKTGNDVISADSGLSLIAMRTTVTGSVGSQSAVPTDVSNSDTVTTGTFSMTSLDMLSAGVLAEDLSYLAVITPFFGNQVDLESVFVRFSNVFNSPWFNIKVGKHELELPASAHRALGLTSGYLPYSYHPGGSANINQFDFGANKFGIELLGHSPEGRVNYALDIHNGSDDANKHPNLYGRLAFQQDHNLSSQKLGFFFNYGVSPLASKTIGGTPIPGTGENNQRFMRAGSDLTFNFGTSGAPSASLSFQYHYGVDAGALVGPTTLPDTAITCPVPPCATPYTNSSTGIVSTGGTQDGIFSGGVIELNLMPSLNTVIFGHYDRLNTSQQPDPALPSDYNNQTGVTIGTRYYYYQTSQMLMAFHLEYSSLTVSKANLVTLEDLVTQTVLAGIDFAF